MLFYCGSGSDRGRYPSVFTYPTCDRLVTQEAGFSCCCCCCCCCCTVQRWSSEQESSAAAAAAAAAWREQKAVGGAPSRPCRLAGSHTHRSSLRLLSCVLSRLKTPHSSSACHFFYCCCRKLHIIVYPVLQIPPPPPYMRITRGWQKESKQALSIKG